MAITRPEFLENKMELTQAGAGAAPSLSSVFGNKSKPGFFSSNSEDNFELHQHEIAIEQGQLDRSQVNTQVNEARSGAEHIRQQEAHKAKQRTGDILFLQLLDQQLADWEREILDMEARFEALYGENWREDLASELLNEIPERRAGESLEAYQERLEGLLVNEMIDPATGKLKDEYRDHPDQRIREYGLWAESRYNFRKAKDLADTVKHGTEQERRAALEGLSKSSNAEIATAASVKLKDDKSLQVEVQGADDVADDHKLTGLQADTQVDSSGFDMGYSG